MKRRIILVVEDEKAILKVILAGLAGMTEYKVMVAVTAEEGLRLGLDLRRKVDMLLSNVMLPGMSGTELAGRLKAKRPDLLVVLIDGKGSGNLATLARQSGWRVLRKAGTGAALLERIRSELESLLEAEPKTSRDLR